MEELCRAHARYERTMADIKSLNLSAEDNELLNDALKRMATTMSRLASALDAVHFFISVKHIPAEPAPNAINRVD